MKTDNSTRKIEINIISAALVKAKDKGLLNELHEILGDLKFNSLNLEQVVKMEQLLGIELIKVPTEEEWKKIHRKEKLEELNKIQNG